MEFSLKKFIYILALSIVILPLLLFFHFKFELNKRILLEDKIVFIPHGSSLPKVLNILKENGIGVNKEYLKVYAHIRNFSRKLGSGEYLLKSGFSTIDIINELCLGKNVTYKITIPEGFNLFEVAALLSRTGIIDEELFKVKCFDADFLSSLKIDNISCEGYLFPETYLFYKGIGAEQIIKKMTENFWKNFTQTYLNRARELGFTLNQLITFASIVEKETGVKEERWLISSVFHNRLKKKMKFQSDPTVIYGIDNYDGNIRKRDLLKPTPYNTYVIPALPIGPISNPGLESLKASLYPPKSDYLYFVSKNDGSHFFSKTFEEHSFAVKKYQLKK